MNRINLNGVDELRFTLPGTTTATIARPGATSIVNAGFNGVNAQSGTSYTVQSSDNQKLVSLNNASSVAVTLPQPDTSGIDSNFAFWITNEGTGSVTITPTSSTIDGQPNLSLTTNQGVIVFTDGTNYFTVRGASSGFSNPMTTQGDLIVGGTSGTPTRLAAGTSGYVLTSNGSGAIPSYQPASGGSGGSGLFASVLPSTPLTISAMNLPTAFNQSGTFTIANQSNGVGLADKRAGGSEYIEGVVMAYPSSPFTAKAILQPAIGGGYSLCGFLLAASLTGKLSVYGGRYNGGWAWSGLNYNSPTSYNGGTENYGGCGVVLFAQFQDNGTNYIFSVSSDGVYYQQVFTVAKSSSWVGAAPAYFGIQIDTDGGPIYCAILNWTITYP